MFRNIAYRGVRYEGDLRDASMMLSNKTDMGDQGTETLPARKCWRFDNETPQAATGFNEWINFLREFHEIGLLKRGLGAHIKNGLRGVKAGFDQGSPLLRIVAA